jgi:DNA-binding transcriptional LysR family regulator
MELRHLRYFAALAEELHFGRAARKLNITQPPLSFNIKQLEASLGVVLLERNSHGVKLTPAGEAFRKAATEILGAAEAATRRARDVAAAVTSRVRVGFVGSMLFRGLPEGLASFRRTHPDVQIELSELNSAEQLQAFGNGLIDLGFVHSERVGVDLRRESYMSEPFVCCLPAAHPAARARRLDPALVLGEPLVLFSRGASPDYYERVRDLSKRLGLDPMVRHEVRHWLSVVALVSRGMGIALVPKALAGCGIGNVRFVTLPDAPVRSEVFMIWNERRMPAVLPELAEHLLAHAPGRQAKGDSRRGAEPGGPVERD